jgi:hypothetical protein
VSCQWEGERAPRVAKEETVVGGRASDLATKEDLSGASKHWPPAPMVFGDWDLATFQVSGLDPGPLAVTYPVGSSPDFRFAGLLPH